MQIIISIVIILVTVPQPVHLPATLSGCVVMVQTTVEYVQITFHDIPKKIKTLCF